MEQQTAVPRQAILLAVLASLAAVACGHRCGLPNLIVLGITALLWLGLLAGYAWQARGRRDNSRVALDRRATMSAAAGFGVPLAVSAVLWQTSSFDGLVFTTDAAAFCAVLVTVFFAVILASRTGTTSCPRRSV